MATSDRYCTLEDVKTAMGISVADDRDDAELDAVIDSASRDVDAHCNRRFFQDTNVVTRSYFPEHPYVLFVDDISTTTGLIVKCDEDGDGTFETTLTIDVDFFVAPVNASAQTPARPWTRIGLITDGTYGSWPTLSSQRPPVQVTAKFGWADVPDVVARATVLQASTLFKGPDTIDNSYQLNDEGAPIRKSTLNRYAARLLEPMVRWDEVHDGV